MQTTLYALALEAHRSELRRRADRHRTPIAPRGRFGILRRRQAS